MFKQNKPNLRSKAENCWNNICAYRKDSAKRISKLYDNDLDKIIDYLEMFSEVKLYSGHRSGKNGDGENKSAMAVLDKGIEHLLDCIKQDTIENKLSN